MKICNRVKRHVSPRMSWALGTEISSRFVVSWQKDIEDRLVLSFAVILPEVP